MSSAVVLLTLLALAVSAAGFLLDDGSLQNLISLISQEKKMRAQVEAEIHALQEDVRTMKSGTSASLCDCPATGVIAFAATITTDIDNLGTNQTIVFDHVINNEGGAYDVRHGTFRAPVSGVYQFSFTILQGQSSMWLGVELVTNGRVIGRVKTGDNGYYNMGSNVINTWLAAGADVWVRHMSDSDSKHVVADNGFYTLFSGLIVRADP